MVNVNLLAKVLAMLGSPNDHEALQAARRSDAMVRAAGTTWAVLLARAPVVKDDVETASTDVPLKKQIAEAFKELGEKTVKSDRRLVELLAVFRLTGYLGPADRKPLFEAVRAQRRKAA